MRLIDADLLEEEGWSLHRTYQKDKETMVYEVKAISEINTIQPDVPDRKVGKWIDEGTNYLCSECHRGCWVNSDYCPWCGARMDVPDTNVGETKGEVDED